MYISDNTVSEGKNIYHSLLFIPNCLPDTVDILTRISYNEYAYFIGSTFALDMISKIFLPNLMWEILKIVFSLLIRVQLQSFPVFWLHGIPCMTACLCHYWSTLQSSLFSPPLEGDLWKFTSGLTCLSLLLDWSLGSPDKRWGGSGRRERSLLRIPYLVSCDIDPVPHVPKVACSTWLCFLLCFGTHCSLVPWDLGWLYCCWKFVHCPLSLGMNPSVKKPSWTVLECCMCFLLGPYLVRMIWFVIAIDCALWQVTTLCCKPESLGSGRPRV